MYIVKLENMIKKSLAQELRRNISIIANPYDIKFIVFHKSIFLSLFLHNFIANLRAVSVLLSLLLKDCLVARLVEIVPAEKSKYQEDVKI